MTTYRAVELVTQGFHIGMTQVHEEIVALVDAVVHLKPKCILEIGAGKGGSFWIWSQIAADACISIDLPGGPWGGQEPVARRGRTERVAEDPRVVHILDNSHSPRTRSSVEAALDGRGVDFLFIDGDHSLVGVTLDYYMYAPLVRPGGLIAFHDIVDSPRHRGLGCHVSEFCAAVPGNKREIRSGADWGGIGLISV